MRERAVRMVFEHQHEYLSQWTAVESIAKKVSINHETLRIWVRRPRPAPVTGQVSRMMSGQGFRTSSVRSKARRAIDSAQSLDRLVTTLS